MADNETITDIIAEMRRDADADDITPDCILGQKLNYLADRLEAAHKREINALTEELDTAKHCWKVWSDRADELLSKCNEQFAKLKTLGNAAKLREALQKAAESAAEIMERVRHKDGLAFNTANYIASIAKDALAAPPRNCDVGTAEEQEKRYNEWLNADVGRAVLGLDPLEWAQMPYEEGGAK